MKIETRPPLGIVARILESVEGEVRIRRPVIAYRWPS